MKYATEMKKIIETNPASGECMAFWLFLYGSHFDGTQIKMTVVLSGFFKCPGIYKAYILFHLQLAPSVSFLSQIL